MRQSFSTLGLVASLAATSHAFYSSYWTHWDDMMDEMDCPNGPVVCGGDTCMEGYACFKSAFGDKCDDVARYQCSKDCGDGHALNPLRYCTCITEAERDAMFCADEADSGSGDGGDSDIDGGPISINCCADTKYSNPYQVTCPSGTLDCEDENDFYCQAACIPKTHPKTPKSITCCSDQHKYAASYQTVCYASDPTCFDDSYKHCTNSCPEKQPDIIIDPIPEEPEEVDEHLVILLLFPCVL